LKLQKRKLVNSIFKTWCHVCKAEVKVKAEKYYNKALDARYKRADEVDLYVKRADENDLYIGYLYHETGRKKESLLILNKFIKSDKLSLHNNEVSCY